MLSKNQIKNIQALHLKKNRQQQGLFIAEGKKIIDEILNSDLSIEHIFATRHWLNEGGREYPENVLNNRITIISEEELKKISALQSPNKVLAVCKQKESIVDYSRMTSSWNIYLDGIRDPGNLGTIIRVADWFGVAHVICSEDCAELYNPKTIQSTMGSFLRVPVVYKRLAEIISDLKKTGIQVPLYGATLNGINIYTEKDFPKGMLLIGNESHGISEEALYYVTKKISIPAADGSPTESLNAAIATSLITAELFRRGLT